MPIDPGSRIRWVASGRIGHRTRPRRKTIEGITRDLLCVWQSIKIANNSRRPSRYSRRPRCAEDGTNDRVSSSHLIAGCVECCVGIAVLFERYRAKIWQRRRGRLSSLPGEGKVEARRTWAQFPNNIAAEICHRTRSSSTGKREGRGLIISLA